MSNPCKITRRDFLNAAGFRSCFGFRRQAGVRWSTRHCGYHPQSVGSRLSCAATRLFLRYERQARASRADAPPALCAHRFRKLRFVGDYGPPRLHYRGAPCSSASGFAAMKLVATEVGNAPLSISHFGLNRAMYSLVRYWSLASSERGRRHLSCKHWRSFNSSRSRPEAQDAHQGILLSIRNGSGSRKSRSFFHTIPLRCAKNPLCLRSTPEAVVTRHGR